MEVLNLIRLFWGWVFPYISRIHTAYIGEYLHFRYLKSLLIILLNYMGIIISQYKDAYKPISIMECHKGLVHAAQLSLRQGTKWLISP